MKYLIITFLVVTLAACSTAITKQLPIPVPDGSGGIKDLNSAANILDGQWGVSYSGLELNQQLWGCWHNYVSTNEKSVGTNLGKSVFSGALLIPLLIDSAFSVSVDTFLLPIDYLVSPTQNNESPSFNFFCSESNNEFSLISKEQTSI